ncbi:MAG TPA: helix-turn-helix domain-containing protein [Spirochaetia bacterium]|nr:helix-turn-helix domain-containing protein [Spirochaetia bacterium]
MSGPNILIINPVNDIEVLKGLASELRVRILELLHTQSMNVNELTRALDMPQSTVATNVQVLESAGLIRTETVKARKGSQKICHNIYQEMLVQFPQTRKPEDDQIEVAMPIGLYTGFEVSAPCGLCSTEGIIGYLDVPDDFLNPGRMKAGLLWFEKGHVEYKFPNNSLYKDKPVKKLEVSAELSSETPGTNKNWLSDITMWINDVEIGYWTSPGDFGDRRGKLTPLWWKLEGSQYGLLKHWIVTEEGSFVDGVRVSDVKLKDLDLPAHHSIRVRIGIKEDAEHLGGLNIFGRGFGNYDQDLVLRLFFT